MATGERRPTPDEVQKAAGRTVPDILAPGLRVLICGINPSLYSAAVGHHFARPGNRMWKALAGAGLTPRVLSPFEDADLLQYGIGMTNLVARATRAASDLAAEELRGGARLLAGKVARHGPRVTAVDGVGAYRTAFGKPHAGLGRQPESLAGKDVWVLPNPSGLNAHYQLPALIEHFRSLERALE